MFDVFGTGAKALAKTNERVEAVEKRVKTLSVDPEMEGHIAHLTGAVKTLQERHSSADLLAPHIASLGVMLKQVQGALEQADRYSRTLTAAISAFAPLPAEVELAQRSRRTARSPRKVKSVRRKK